MNSDGRGYRYCQVLLRINPIIGYGFIAMPPAYRADVVGPVEWEFLLLPSVRRNSGKSNKNRQKGDGNSDAREKTSVPKSRPDTKKQTAPAPINGELM